MLRADSPLLLAMDRLPRAPHVKQHSIIGKFRPMLGAWCSDGVVPVSSAKTCPVISEKLVHANHGGTHQNHEGIAELIRIMRCHVAETQALLNGGNSEPMAPGPEISEVDMTPADSNGVQVLLTDSPLRPNVQESGWRVRQDD